MKTLPFAKIDAFASAHSSGNPAGFIQLDRADELTPSEMQQLALELKGCVNEVGFANREADDALRLRFFSSECEVAFCGHAIIGIMHTLLQQDPALAALKRLRLFTNKGLSWVENRMAEDNAVYIWAPPPVFETETFPTDKLAAAIGTPVGELRTDLPCTLLNAGLSTLLVPLRRLDALLTLRPDQARLRQFCLNERIEIITCFTTETSCPGHDLRSRVFAPIFGYLEDPATGSGNAALGYYLRSHNSWRTSHLTIEQNSHRTAPNTVRLLLQIDSDGNERVLFGGGAIVRFTGSYFLHQSAEADA